MATKAKVTDQFANIAALSVAETVAGTLASSKFQFPFSIMDKMGLLISRIEYWLMALGNLNSANDYAIVGLAAASTLVDPTNQADPSMIDSARSQRIDFGAAASGILLEQPYVKDFSNLPGGGLLVAPNPLYGFIIGVGAAASVSAWIKVFYTYMELAADEYWQLVESRRIISS